MTILLWKINERKTKEYRLTLNAAEEYDNEK